MADELLTVVILSCHCGAVQFELAHAPETVTECNCSFCRRVGVLWAYYKADEATLLTEPLSTTTYAWNGKHVDFHRCATCGCLTHWVPRTNRPQRGFNARLFDPEVLAAARLRHKDGAVTGKYLD